MEVLIVEDERLSRERLSELILRYDPQIKLVGSLDSVEETVHFLQTHEHPDLLFFDIQLADGLSFEIFQQVTVRKPIIFTTAYDQYALKSFEVNSLDYLIKPINYERLVQALKKYQSLEGPSDNTISPDIAKLVLQSQKIHKERFLVKLGRKLFYKPVAEIGYFYADGKIVYLVEKKSSRKFLIDHTLDELANKHLDPGHFFRINRTFIISIESVMEVQPHSNQRLLVKLNQTHNQDLIVSRERSATFKAWLNY